MQEINDDTPKKRPLFKPAVILHGGASTIERSRLPPELYEKYRSSLLSYLRSTNDILNADDQAESPDSNSAIDAAVHAVACMEDDELFNSGRGSVFTSAGEIEMEASVMATSVRKGFYDGGGDSLRGEPGSIKRGFGVMRIKNVRHPVMLARELLLRTGNGAIPDASGNMHSQLAGPYAESLAKEWGLEFKPDDWFWTKKRWDEHKRGLENASGENYSVDSEALLNEDAEGMYLSQGTVGAVCLDRWGNLAAATSTGGLTNKAPGRVGDTPTLGAGFWAEAWDVEQDTSNETNYGGLGLTRPNGVMAYERQSPLQCNNTTSDNNGNCSPLSVCLAPWLSPIHTSDPSPPPYTPNPQYHSTYHYHPLLQTDTKPRPQVRRRALALSGTGNGDSFLRISAAHTTSAMCRFSSHHVPLADAVTAVAGPGGELQRSAGRRWGLTQEGLGGIIGIEVEMEVDKESKENTDRTGSRALARGKVAADFNCGGMFRAWYEEGEDGRDVERLMVFRDEYK